MQRDFALPVTHERGALAFDRDAIFREPRLEAKGATRPLLALKTVANRAAGKRPGDREFQLAAAAAGFVGFGSGRGGGFGSGRGFDRGWGNPWIVAASQQISQISAEGTPMDPLVNAWSLSPGIAHVLLIPALVAAVV